MIKFKAAILIILAFFSFDSFAEKKSTPLQDKTLLYKDAVYELEIKTVQLYPNTGHPGAVILPSVAPLGNNNLILEFDDLVQGPEDYKAKIIHCNSNWEPSRLRNLDYLYDYNEFNLRNYELSVDTKISYVHYKFKLPNVKLPGNYLLVVYRGTNESDIILSKRFMIYSNNVGIAVTSNLAGVTSINRMNQQIDFKVDYNSFPMQNPMENVYVVLRQNQRWDNAITNLRPTFIREVTSELEYYFFNYENNFAAGNEFRFFDMRSLRHPGQNVQQVHLRTHPITVQLMVDLPRNYQVYTQYDDLEGDFFIANADTGNGSVQSDYVTTQFTLKSEKVPGDVYVMGEMNNWSLSHPMTYHEQAGIYSGEMILKQGYYDYQYYVAGDSLKSNYFEGNHFETENEYEIFVYYREPGSRGDLLIGYTRLMMNEVN